MIKDVKFFFHLCFGSTSYHIKIVEAFLIMFYFWKVNSAQIKVLDRWDFESVSKTKCCVKNPTVFL